MKKRIMITGIGLVLLVLTLVPAACNNTVSPTDTTTNTSSSTSTSATTTTDITTPTETTTTEEVLFPEIGRTSIEELKTMIDQGEDIVIIDTRDISVYAAGHIPKAIDITWMPVGDPQEFAMRLWSLPTNKKIIVYCDCPDESTSGIVASTIQDEVFLEDDSLVTVLFGGWAAWRDAEYPIATGETIEGGTVS